MLSSLYQFSFLHQKYKSSISIQWVFSRLNLRVTHLRCIGNVVHDYLDKLPVTF